jgi:hypothetical protein
VTSQGDYSAKNPLKTLPIGFPHCEMLGCLFGLCCGASCHIATPAPRTRIAYVAPHHITTLPLWLLCNAPMLQRTILPTLFKRCCTAPICHVAPQHRAPHCEIGSHNAVKGSNHIAMHHFSDPHPVVGGPMPNLKFV